MKKLFLLVSALLITSTAFGTSLSGVTLSGVSVDPRYAYGVRWDQTVDTYQEGYVTPSGVWTAATIDDFPVQRSMQRVVLQDDGTVNYKLCPYNSALKEDCTTASVLDGTDGQVMVQVQKFYYIQEQYSNYRYFIVSYEPFSLVLPDSSVVTAAIHPAFYGGDVTASNYIYVGAYQANLYDVSGSAYVGGASITEDCANDKLASVNGILPIVSFTRACGRTMAAARGAGWHQLDNNFLSALQILMVTEWGSLRGQQSLGDCVTKYAAFPNVPQWLAGNSNGIGNASGDTSAIVAKWAATTAYSLGTEVIPLAAQTGYTYRVTGAGTSAGAEPTWPTTLGNTVVDDGVTWTCVYTEQYCSYRAVEHPWGGIWMLVDGANIHNSATNGSRLYLATDHTAYADDTDTGYSLAGNLVETDGYVTDLLDALGFWPETVGGSLATYLADYYYTNYDNNNDLGWRGVLFGGGAHDSVLAGPFCVYSGVAASFASSDLGGRLVFKP